MRTSFFSDDTICAVATPPGMGAIAVVRVSGPQSHEIVCRLFHQHGKSFAKEQIQGYRCYFGQIIAPKKTTTVTVCCLPADAMPSRPTTPIAIRSAIS